MTLELEIALENYETHLKALSKLELIDTLVSCARDLFPKDCIAIHGKNGL